MTKKKVVAAIKKLATFKATQDIRTEIYKKYLGTVDLSIKGLMYLVATGKKDETCYWYGYLIRYNPDTENFEIIVHYTEEKRPYIGPPTIIRKTVWVPQDDLKNQEVKELLDRARDALQHASRVTRKPPVIAIKELITKLDAIQSPSIQEVKAIVKDIWEDTQTIFEAIESLAIKEGFTHEEYKEIFNTEYKRIFDKYRKIMEVNHDEE